MIWLAVIGIAMIVVGAVFSWASSRSIRALASEQEASAKKGEKVTEGPEALALAKKEEKATERLLEALAGEQKEIAASLNALVATQDHQSTMLLSRLADLSNQIKRSNRWNIVSLVGVALTILSMILRQCG